MHILHFKMSISVSKCAIIISNIHLLMYCWNKLQQMQHKNWLFFFFNVVKYDTSHLRQLIGSGLLNAFTTVVEITDFARDLASIYHHAMSLKSLMHNL